ncbi:LysR family transcriptional regulator [uncultured Tateyamaria sp.]|uniref:LysR family transcriptional regulator n=1 Tax=uncultured Tateyamaria sp. TaxID=455651 RepID=UPI002632CA5A|nr:LysR family transcriptional regulator [uncultured Tateyamaria sp.]
MRLSGFNLNQLVCLGALLTESNVTRAAKRVHLSQSAMSAVLSQLRLHFDDELLVRSGRNMVLTPFARSLIGPMNALIRQAQTFAALRPGEYIPNADRELTVVASDFVVQTCLSSAINKTMRELNGLTFDILPLADNSGKLLQNGEVDLLLAGQSLDVGMPPKAEVFSDSFVCLTCDKHGADLGTLTEQIFLESEHVVVRYLKHQIAHDDEEVLRLAGHGRKRSISLWTYSLVPYFVCGTERIATVPARSAYMIAKRWPVRIHSFPFEHEPVRVFAYWHSSRENDDILNRFLNVLK